MRFTALLIVLILSVPYAARAEEQTVTLEIKQMDCSLCKVTIRKALTKVEGVKSAEVSYESKTAIVTYEDELTTTQALTEATTNAGYPSALRTGNQSNG